LNGDKHFIQMPGIPQTTLVLLQFPRIRGSNLLAPLANRFIDDSDASFSQEFFDFTKAQAEAMIEPHGVADNVRREPMALVAGCCGAHATQFAKSQLT